VVASGALTVTDVRRHCAPRLAAHKIPRVVIFVDAIPMTERGKTDERAVRALILANDSKPA
jgi:acyl-CoA synthetase (AMP-forming)/AMP-acid ligase II